MKKLMLAALILAGQTAAQVQAAEPWKIDTAHSSANFSVRHMMVSNVRGSFGGVTGSANYDGKDLKNLSVDAAIDVKTINTNDSGRDEHLRGDDFFAVEKFPQIKFKSTGIKSTGKDHLKLTGELTMHGVTKPVELDVEGPSDIVVDSKKGIERTGATATTTISRKDFGIEYGNKLLETGGVAIGDEVKVTLDIELTRPSSNKKASTN